MDFNAIAGSQTSQTTAPASSQKSGLASLADSQAFLNLFVSQLKYQDPLNPASGDEFLAQTAQFTSVEQLTQLNQKMEDFALAGRMAAASLIGRQVSGTVTGADGAGATITGAVAQLSYGEKGALTLKLEDGTALPMVNVISVA